MATSINVVLRRKPNKKGECPLALRITKDRKSSFISLGFTLDEKHWNLKEKRVKKSHPNSSRLNNLIAKKLSEASDSYLEKESKGENLQAADITEYIGQKTASISFFEKADEYLSNLEKTGQFTRHMADKSRIKNLKEFLKNKNISFESLTVALLRKFEAYLMGAKGLRERTVMNHFVVFRTIFNQAIADNLVDRAHYPFGRGKIIIKFPQSLKIGLSREEVGLIESFQPKPNTQEQHSKNLWLLSFYFAGMRASDIIQLKWSDIQDGRLFDQMDKNSKVGSLKISPQAQTILDQYSERQKQNLKYVFPLLDTVNERDPSDLRRKISNAIGLTNKYLKRIAKTLEIEKPLTMHIARHTFGNISGDRIPVQMLQKLYRHSSITTTIGYQSNFMFKDTDDALEAVIG